MSGLIVRDISGSKGVFATKNFSVGEKLIDFQGEIIHREKIPIFINESDDHYLQISENFYLGPSGLTDDFFNHSCDPNSGVIVNGKTAKLIAIKPIKKDEEVLFDYSTTMFKEKQTMRCLCNSSKCRKIIGDFQHLPDQDRQRYIKLGIVPSYNLHFD